MLIVGELGAERVVGYGVRGRRDDLVSDNVGNVQHLTGRFAIDIFALTSFREFVPSAPLGVLEEKVFAGAFLEQPPSKLEAELLNQPFQSIERGVLINNVRARPEGNLAHADLKPIDSVS